MDRVAVSKYLSYLLRHHPEGLDIDHRGYVPVEQILARLRPRFPTIDRNRFQQVVDSNGKQRFELQENKIRARYGHSIPVDLQLPTAENIETLYHGTTQEAAHIILEQGLQPRGRQMVHLSATRKEARRVGRRYGRPVVLHIDATAARSQDITFYRATDEVYLAAFVPASVISRADCSKRL